jgi:hypothetical protein
VSDNYITEPDIYDCEIEIIAEAFTLRDNALKSAGGIDTVENLYEANQAKVALDALAELIKGIEASRTQAKKPALELGRKIDGIAKDFITDAASEKERIRKILGAYQVIEAKKKQEAEREARRKEQAILDAAQVEADKRIAEERKGRTGTMLADTETIAEKADKQIAAARQEAANSHNAVAGLRVRKTLKFEIKDAAALLANRPDLFSPDDSKIRAAIKLTQSIPGLEIWEESTAY